jgi:pyruvate,water dikinase
LAIPETKLVIPLAAIKDRDESAVGAKAIGLARMGSIGLSVPAGFCVTAAAYHEHLKCNHLMSRLAADTAKLADAAPTRRRDILAGIRQTIVAVPMADELVEKIRSRYKTLKADRIAVRSSATAEDLPGHSFAGQHDTYLGITNIEDCIEGVKKCWASLWTERAYVYREKNGSDHLEVKMAVIVQLLVSADASGVLFTADPVTGRTDRVIVEATFGLGDLLVSGKVTGDRFVIHKKNIRILSRIIADKKIERILDGDGLLTEQEVPAEQSHKPSIDDKIARKLAKLAKKAEIRFGGPQDMEWALDGTEIFFLQSRPITTLGRTQLPRDLWIWSNFLAQEVMPDVVTPVTKSLIDNVAADMFDPVFDILCIDRRGTPLYDYFAGRAYFNASFWAAVIRYIPGLKRYDFARFTGSNAALAKILEILKNVTEDDLPEIKVGRTRFILKLPILIAGILSCTPRKGQAILAETRAKNKKWEHLDVAGMSTEQIVGCCAEVITAFRDMLGYAPYLFATMISYFGLELVCEKWFSDTTYAGRLLAGVGDMNDAEAAMDLWQLAAKVHQSPQVERVILSELNWQSAIEKFMTIKGSDQFLKSWDEFMARHGHHCRGEIETYNRRWFETPDYILKLVRSYLAGIDRTDPIQNYSEQTQRRRQLEEQCRRQLRNPVKRMLFNHLLVRSQASAVLRENIKSEVIKLVAGVRKLLVELGRKLHAGGVLAGSDDIFFLTFEEIGLVVGRLAEFDIRNVIAARRAEYDKWNLVTPPDVIVGGFDPDSYVPEEIKTDSKALRGLAVSPGVATGKARVILRSDSNTLLEAGEILVAPFTDPGWTPYFLLAAGIVMDQGSILSHGSIVAREYGLPAVVNVGSATKIIKTGQTIQVDANQGIVRILR